MAERPPIIRRAGARESSPSLSKEWPKNLDSNVNVSAEHIDVISFTRYTTQLRQRLIPVRRKTSYSPNICMQHRRADCPRQNHSKVCSQLMVEGTKRTIECPDTQRSPSDGGPAERQIYKPAHRHTFSNYVQSWAQALSTDVSNYVTARNAPLGVYQLCKCLKPPLLGITGENHAVSDRRGDSVPHTQSTQIARTRAVHDIAFREIEARSRIVKDEAGDLSVSVTEGGHGLAPTELTSIVSDIPATIVIANQTSGFHVDIEKGSTPTIFGPGAPHVPQTQQGRLRNKLLLRQNIQKIAGYGMCLTAFSVIGSCMIVNVINSKYHERLQVFAMIAGSLWVPFAVSFALIAYRHCPINSRVTAATVFLFSTVMTLCQLDWAEGPTVLGVAVPGVLFMTISLLLGWLSIKGGATDVRSMSF